MLCDLPDDVLLVCFYWLDIQSITNLSYCNRHLRALAVSKLPTLVQQSGLQSAVTVPSLCLEPHFKPEQYFSRLQRAATVQDQWERLNGARHVLATSPRRTMPVLRLQRYHRVLLTASGPQMSAHHFDHRGRCKTSLQTRSPGVMLGRTNRDDITAIAQAGDESPEIVVAHHSGLLHRVHLQSSKNDATGFTWRSVARFDASAGSSQANHAPIGSISVDSSGFLVASICRPRQSHSRSILAIHQLRSPWITPTSMPLSHPLWSVHVCSEGSLPWVATGHSDRDSLLLYHLRPEGVSQPMALGSEEKENMRAAVPYALVTPKSGVLSPQHLIAAGFDGNTRVYDCR